PPGPGPSLDVLRTTPGRRAPRKRTFTGALLSAAFFAAIFGLLAILAVPAGRAQEATLDVLDGETLYEHGWLITAAYQIERKGRLLSGDQEIHDPLRQVETDQGATLAAHYGLRHDLQLSAIVPFVHH